MNLTSINYNLPLGTVFEDDPSDSYSSGEHSDLFSPRSNKENNNYYQQGTTDCDSESTMHSQNKKIRKKRTAYNKIDDDIRVQLWEAVQQNGETLKSAAKRLNINYSSAKSILHTYRKEGRILKKNALERTLKLCTFSPSELDMPQFNTYPTMTFEMNKFEGVQNNFGSAELYQETTIASYENTNCSSPMHGLADNLGQMTFDNQLIKQELSMPAPNLPLLKPLTKPKIPINEMTPQNSTQGSAPSPVIPSLNLPANHQLGNPLEKLKHFDNFYMNYSNSPLSGNNKMFQECSDSGTGSRSRYEKEFDSFSDMVSCLQRSNISVISSTIETKGDIQTPKLLKSNTSEIVQEKIEEQTGKEESPMWKGTLENAAFETYKSFMDAQFLLQDAMKKANRLNNLVSMQQSGVSPTNNWKI